MSSEYSPPLRLVYLSRVTPKKNLLTAVGILKLVRTPIRFSVYGPLEDKLYWSKCKKAIEELPPHIDVIIHGPITPEVVSGELSKHDLFFLPTFGENYGHVIMEALAAGLPILISDQTPWRNLAAKGIGRDLPLGDPQLFANFIEEAANWDGVAHQAVIANVRAFAAKASNPTRAVAANREMLRLACEG